MTDVKPIGNDDLLVHILNVGRGDTIVIEFPAGEDGLRSYGIVDCFNFSKLADYLDRLRIGREGHKHLEFLCATHPHSDHILGIPNLVRKFPPKFFWDSGFRHMSQTYIRILETLRDKRVPLVRVSSGMEWYFGKVCVTALAPSVTLRNTYGTYGVDVNNASIVLRIVHYAGDTVLMQSDRYSIDNDQLLESRTPRSTVILGGDAEFDSWAVINEEFPQRHATSQNDPLVKKMINMVDCSVLKVAHHGSMHSIPLEVLERMSPSLAVVSSEQTEGTVRRGELTEYSRTLFPHPSTISALKETCTEVLSTDGQFDWPSDSERTTGEPGSVVIVVPPGGQPRWRKLDDTRNGEPPIVDEI